MAVLAAELQSRGIATASGEMLWGAVNHIINAIVEHHGLAGNTGNPLSRRRAMEYLRVSIPGPLRWETALPWSGNCTVISTTST